MSKHNISVGRMGEEMAERYLVKNGYSILAKRYRKINGEIDLIAALGECIVFVEVKTRSGITYGTPADAVTKKKQRTISSVAEQYLLEQNCMDQPVRFDVIEVYVKERRICHIPDAFFPCID